MQIRYDLEEVRLYKEKKIIFVRSAKTKQVVAMKRALYEQKMENLYDKNDTRKLEKPQE